MGETKKSAHDSVSDPTVNFDYIKSTQFRVIHVDGAIGGITPSGNVHISLYSERPAIPKQVVHNVKANGTLGDEIGEKRVSRGGIVREMDVDVVMSIAAAETLCSWLQQKIEEGKEQISEAQEILEAKK